MIKTPLIIGVYTCPKYSNRQKAVCNTWFKEIPDHITALFVMSDPGRPARIEGNTLFLDCPEGYEFLTVKTFRFVEFCLTHFDFEYIFKADDDTYLDILSFLQFKKQGDYIGRMVGSSDKDIDRTWHFGKFAESSLEKPYQGKFIAKWAAGGDGYFLSRRAAEFFNQHAKNLVNAELESPDYCGYEDKFVGDILSTKPELISQNAPLASFGSIHPATPTAMLALHQYSKKLRKPQEKTFRQTNPRENTPTKAESTTIIGIFTCPKNRFRAKVSRATWIKQVPENFKVLFVQGRSGVPPSIDDDVLYLDCPEAYEKLSEKTHKFFEYCVKNLEFEYIFKTDDDSYIDMEKFLKYDKKGGDYIGHFGKSENTKINRTWHYGKCTDKSYEVPYKGQYVCGWARGGGYFVSKRAASILVDKTSQAFKNELFEDKMVGEALTRDKSIKVVNTHYSEMGVLNPLLPKDMIYVQSILKDKKRIAREMKNLKEEVSGLKNQLADVKIARGNPISKTIRERSFFSPLKRWFSRQ